MPYVIPTPDTGGRMERDEGEKQRKKTEKKNDHFGLENLKIKRNGRIR